MRAAVVTPAHGFEVVDLPDPTPGPADMVLRVEACGICGSDLKAHTFMPAGAVLGHEYCGEVVGLGAEVTGWREGDVVAAMPLGSCGRCRWCLSDRPNHCAAFDPQGVGGSPGAFAEYLRVPAASAVRLEPGTGDLGALVEPLAVGLHTVAAARIRPGARVLVLGGGNVGAAVTVWARRLGAIEVVVSDPAPGRRDSAGLFGATDVHDPTEGAAPTGFDVVVECVGIPGMIDAAVAAVAPLGRVVVAGVCATPDQITPLAAVLKEVEMAFVVYYGKKEFAAAADLLLSGGIDAGAFVTRRAGLDGVGQAFTDLLGGAEEGKILITPNEPTRQPEPTDATKDV